MKCVRRLQRAGVLAVLLAVLPTPGSLWHAPPRAAVPVDPALRVPLSAVLLGSGRHGFALEDRLLAVSSPAVGGSAPRTRADLDAWVLRTGARHLDVEVAGRSGRERLDVVRETGAHRILRDAPTFLAGLLLLGLAFVLPRSPAHPAVPPLFAASCVTGALLLAQLDLVIGDASSLLPVPGIRARVGAAAFMLLPAAWIHLAARFPGPAARLPGAAVLPYACWGVAAVFAQVHLEDAALRNVLDRMALGAGAGALMLVLVGLLAERPQRPIERARVAVLFGSVAVAAGFGVAAWWGSPAEAGWAAASLVVALVVFPFGVAGSILRYGLAELPSWFRRLVAASRPVARRRYERERQLRASLDRFAQAASEAAGWRTVRAALLETVNERLQPESCTVLDLAAPGSSRTCLERAGVRLWSEAGAARGPVRVTRRREDPDQHHAELVVPILPACGRRLLVVLSGRRDGLPWAASDERMLLSFVPVALTALDAAAKRDELARRVDEQTATLQRGVEDRERLLEAAREIGEAERVEEVRSVLARLRGELGRGAPLETAAVLAELACARLELLAGLRHEVECQAGELALQRSRRLHAEFVRGVAHELRKPLDALVRQLDLAGRRSARGATDLTAARRAGAELGRRLDLLLVHSGLCLDRQRFDLIDVARRGVAAARELASDRSITLDPARSRLPVIGDPARLASVLENLLDNAIRATRPGQPITVRVGTAIRNGAPLAVLEIEDEGCGIPPDRLEQIFEPGVSLLPGGFGLGLALCRQIVEMHGGTLEVTSGLGRTVFRATWPRVAHAAAAEDVENAA